MYLKRLEIQGFKSFADQVDLALGPGITVVVGPNGCGKSNLTEAIQWVLGEQSARALRGYKMDDVIFAGTSNRHPLGMAEVSLTFDNSGREFPLAYGEVCFTRRIYRSGESEYLINRTPCRLRDIQELLATCGIGRAAFAVVAQGKIDEFLTVRPEERRVYLEEAAGIGRYRQRRSESLLKLEETEEELVRLRDLLSELERQRQPLVEQAQIAREYRYCSRQLQELEGCLLRDRLNQIREKQRQVESTRQEVLAVLTLAKPRITAMEQELKELAGGVQAGRQRLQGMEQELARIKEEQQENSLQQVRGEERLAAILSRQEELTSRLQGDDQHLAEELQGVKAAREACLSSKDRLTREEQQLEQRQEALERQEKAVEQAQAANNDALFDLLHKKTALQSRLRELENKRELTTRRQESLQQQAEEGKQRNRQLAGEIASQEELYRRQMVALKESRDARERWQRRLAGLQRRLGELREAVQRSQEEIQATRARVSILREAEEGYQRGVRSILQAMAAGNPACRGIIGPAEELLAAGPGYETALQTALGRAGQYLVCDTPETAQRAIAYLKEKGLGRASFLPLTAVDYWVRYKPRTAPLRSEGVLGVATELVSCEPRYRAVAEFLLGRTYFSQDLKAARLFAERNHYRVRVVTLEGEMIQPGGLITGGRTAVTPRGHQRKREVARLVSVLAGQERQLAELRQEEKKVSAETGQAEARLRELDDRLRQGELQQDLLRQKLSSLKQEQDRLQDFIQGFLLRGEAGGWQAGDLEQEITTLQEELKGVLQQEQELTLTRERLESEKRECLNGIREIQRQSSELKVQRARLEEQQEHLELLGQDLQNRLEHYQTDRKRKGEELVRLRVERAQLQEQQNNLTSRQARLSGQAAALVRQLEDQKRRLTSRQAYCQTRGKHLARLQQIVYQRQEQLRTLKLQLEHLKEQETQLVARAAELGIDLERGEARALSRQEVAAIKDNMTRCRQKLDDLGEVNFQAPVELEALQQRYDLLLQQQVDLQDGKKKLEGLIRELDRVAANRFQRTYQEIKKNFEEVFASLCEGGHAELLLTDADNPLTSGLEIMVSPKGKHPRHLSLLSGGERALAGISFLFALLKNHASPFYLLDEIEAFLDEANLARFAAYLKRVGEQHQVILISHRYQTMQVADTLYGVTMEEPGVSKVISVRLDEWENPLEERSNAS